MRTRERGIGNLPFIAILVLFVIAVVMFFFAQDKADKAIADRGDAIEKAQNSNKNLIKTVDAFNAAVAMIGVEDNALKADTQSGTFPEAVKVSSVLATYLNDLAGKLQRAAVLNIDTTVYTYPPGVTDIKGEPGAKSTYVFYKAPAPSGITFARLVSGIPLGFETVAGIAADNNSKFYSAKTTGESRVKAERTASAAAKTVFVQENASKQAAAESWKTQLDDTRGTLETMTAKLDQKVAQHSAVTSQLEKSIRDMTRDRDAWKNRAQNEKELKALAVKEDPIDGQVLATSRTLGTLWINLGRRNKLSRGTKFMVWRPGKGNIRQNVALVRVIAVDEHMSECRVLKRYVARIAPTKGMNVSNPFYDPQGKLTAYIFGDLRAYSTNQAARRLAAAGISVSRSLDHDVDVIILGEPPKTGDPEIDADDEAAMAAAGKKAALDRSKRLEWIMKKAISIGAIVVNEKVLADFVDY